MNIFIKPTFLLFGATPAPVIQGFTVFAKASHWMCATDGQRFYIVGGSPSFWLLFEINWNRNGMRLARPMPGGLNDLLADRTIRKDRFTELVPV